MNAKTLHASTHLNFKELGVKTNEEVLNRTGSWQIPRPAEAALRLSILQKGRCIPHS